MLISLVQLNTTVGDITGNKNKILAAIQAAKNIRADLILFQEMVLTGYPPRDRLEMPAFINEAEDAQNELAAQATDIAIILGNVVKNPQKQGRRLLNSAVFMQHGRVQQIIPKTLLPSYDVFDEGRYFEPGHGAVVIPFQGRKLGVTICEDIWHELYPSIYQANPVTELVKQGADLLINLSASPYSLEKFSLRRTLTQNITRQFSLPMIYLNQVGGNDELIFDGGSFFMNEQGQMTACAQFFREDHLIIDTAQNPPVLHVSGNELEHLLQALVLGLKDYVEKCGFKKVTLGLSGGIDSALTAVLAVKALGPDNVIGLIMPSRYSSSGSVLDSLALAKKLDINVHEVPIENIHQAYEQSLAKLFGPTKPDQTEENIQARIRGNLLMALSNKQGALVLTTGNKSEYSVGYATLYGDMSGGLAVISDLPKTLVYQLAKFINQDEEIIPQATINKPPSAELKPNQLDADSLPPYEILDEILKLYIEELKSAPEITACGFDNKTVQEVINRVQNNEYKRRQAPPGLRVSPKAFGTGRRFPIACKW